jgi:hypothetical protein
LINIPALQWKIPRQIPVMIPLSVKYLHNTHTTFNKPPGLQCACSEGPRLCDLRPIQIEDGLRFIRDISEFWNGALHAERHLILGNPRLYLWISTALERLLVQASQTIEHQAARTGINALRIVDEQNRISGGAQSYSLVLRGKET